MELDKIEIGGIEYVIDFDAISNLLNIDEKEVVEVDKREYFDGEGKLIKTEVRTNTFTKPKEYDATKYNLLNILFEILLTYNEEIDDVLGLDRALSQAPIPFKISYNTLIENKILKIAK